MADLDHQDDQTMLLNLVDHPVIAHTDSPPIPSAQFLGTRGSGIGGQVENRRRDSIPGYAVNCRELLLGNPQDLDLKTQTGKSEPISLTACSKGTASCGPDLARS